MEPLWSHCGWQRPTPPEADAADAVAATDADADPLHVPLALVQWLHAFRVSKASAPAVPKPRECLHDAQAFQWLAAMQLACRAASPVGQVAQLLSDHLWPILIDQECPNAIRNAVLACFGACSRADTAARVRWRGD